MATITVKDAAGNDVELELPSAAGRAAAAGSKPVVLATEDKAALDALATALGEVQASPTANTVLDRLKAIATAVTTLAGHVDGLEGLATSLNGFVDGLEALTGTTNTSLTTLQGLVDGLEGALADVLTITAFQARVPTNGAKAASGSIPMVLSNDQDPVLDHANAAIATVTTSSATAITPLAGARYALFLPSVDMFIRTDGAAASTSAAGSIKLFANVPRDLPVVGGTAVTAIVASGTGELRITPSKSR